MPSVLEPLEEFAAKVMNNPKVMMAKLLLTVLTTYLDIFTDVSVIMEQWVAGNTVWVALLILFLVLYPILSAGYYAFLTFKGCYNTVKEGVCRSLAALLMLDPLIASVSAFRRGSWNASALKKTTVVDGMMTALPVHYLKLLEALFESLPSGMLQSYIALVSPGPITSSLALSLVMGWISVATAIALFRLGDHKYGRFGFLIRRWPLVSLVLMGLLSLGEIAIRIGTVAVFAAAYKGVVFLYFLLSGCVMFLLLSRMRRRKAVQQGSWFQDAVASMVNLVVLYQPLMASAGAAPSTPKTTSSDTVVPVPAPELSPESRATAHSPAVPAGAGADEAKSESKLAPDDAIVHIGVGQSSKAAQQTRLQLLKQEAQRRRLLFAVFASCCAAMAVVSFFPPASLLSGGWASLGPLVPGNVTMGLGQYSNSSRCEVLTSGRERCPFHVGVAVSYWLAFTVMVLSFCVLEMYLMRPTDERRQLSDLLADDEDPQAVLDLLAASSDVEALCKAKSDLGLLPLHELASCKGMSEEVMGAVLQANPGAIQQLSEEGDSPLHLSLRRRNVALTTAMLGLGGGEPTEGDRDRQKAVQGAVRLEDYVSLILVWWWRGGGRVLHAIPCGIAGRMSSRQRAKGKGCVFVCCAHAVTLFPSPTPNPSFCVAELQTGNVPLLLAGLMLFDTSLVECLRRAYPAAEHQGNDVRNSFLRPLSGDPLISTRAFRRVSHTRI